MFDLPTDVRLDAPLMLLLLIPTLAVAIRAVYRPLPALRVSWLRPFAKASKHRRGISLLRFPILLEFLGATCLIIALARPQYGIEEQKRRAQGIDIMLALDVSESMEAIDIPNGSGMAVSAIRERIKSGESRPRIAVARDEVARFIDRRPNDRIGLIAFSENPYTVCPPTLDHAFLKMHLDRLEAGQLDEHTTALAPPISTATYRLRDSEAKRRVLVLFTDGDNNVDGTVSPQQAARIADMFDVTIHTVGIGSSFAVALVRTFFGRHDVTAVGPSLNEDLLKELAETTGGTYFNAEDEAGLAAAIDAIDQMEKIDLETPQFIDYRDTFNYWLIAGISLLLIGAILEHTLLLRVP
jgi:Ca-activated chloride channel family protein